MSRTRLAVRSSRKNAVQSSRKNEAASVLPADRLARKYLLFMWHVHRGAFCSEILKQEKNSGE